jgi:hypothetical protein
METTNKHH